MQTAVQALKQVKSRAEEICNSQQQRFPDAASVGDFWRQGDVYVTKLEKCSSSRKMDGVVLQVAPGNTKGSRHVLDSAEGVEMFQPYDSSVLTGPQIRLTEERILTHPEHGDLVLPPGCYQITYQRAFADELKRVRD